MLKPTLLLSLLLTGMAVSGQKKQTVQPYFPPPDSWERKTPRELGLNTDRINEAIALAKAAESKNPRSMEVNHYQTFGKEPFGEGIGPFADRGDATGIIIYKGYIVATWGEPLRCDMTHSVTKSFLSATVGLAVDQGLIRNVHDTVADYVPPVELFTPGQAGRSADLIGQPQLLQPFATAHNRTITWDHLLRQVSDWEGTLWGKPEWADRPDPDASKWRRQRNAPGTVYEYNDVRVNLLALAATGVWRRPLPQVLKQYIMDPIGASNTWRWTGYRNAWIVLDGQPVQSVSGGGHWGGGMFINAYDMARFGWLTLNRGKWNGKQLLSEQWVQQSLTPTPVKPDYGYMNWFLNTGKKLLPSAPESAFMHVGNGNNIIYVDPEHQVVAVIRWIDGKSQDGVIGKILEAMK
ncbi:serine hydrolase domain-containing protein [Sediminibacterium soli]|uniref:serine hydrolase domain-containing protein n=1 Tax=Sediminibacterium soli TaxID=2698829 RepID=UPI00137A5CB4|nr:serine hydrolase [Sediminibacterium soli]NCI45561.1 serine hydrolase [Sediminibacterium soli]